jgi:hypothetical protein
VYELEQLIIEKDKRYQELEERYANLKIESKKRKRYEMEYLSTS